MRDIVLPAWSKTGPLHDFLARPIACHLLLFPLSGAGLQSVNTASLVSSKSQAFAKMLGRDPSRTGGVGATPGPTYTTGGIPDVHPVFRGSRCAPKSR